jgi:small subunit ribosomal protein S18
MVGDAGGPAPAFKAVRTAAKVKSTVAPTHIINPFSTSGFRRGRCGIKCRVDTAERGSTFGPPFRAMTNPEAKQQTPTPAEIPFTQPEAMIRYVTDTGKILPRKYTGLSAKHQRAVTRTIKHSRNMLLAK